MQEQFPVSIDEALLERFVRYPASLSPSTIEAVASYMETNAWARETVTFYVSFYETLDGDFAEAEPVSVARPAEARFLARLQMAAR